MGYPEELKTREQKRLPLPDIAWFNGFKNRQSQ
jgi:hypothetical protein